MVKAEIVHPGRETFPQFVGSDVIFQAGFNWWETSMLVYHERRLCSVYMAHRRDTGLRIVVVQDKRRVGRSHVTDWYFGTFHFPNNRFKTQQSYEDFEEQVTSLISVKNKVPGKALEELILEVLAKENKPTPDEGRGAQ